MNLTAISPATKTVALGSAAVEVTGLSLRKLTQLVVAYPDLVALAAGGKIDIASVIGRGPEMGLAIFSLAVVGMARPRFWQRVHAMSDERLLAAFDKAPTGQQIQILGAIVDLTFNGGERARPFLRSVVASLGASTTETSSDEPEPGSAAQGEPTSVETTPEQSSN